MPLLARLLILDQLPGEGCGTDHAELGQVLNATGEIFQQHRTICEVKLTDFDCSLLIIGCSMMLATENAK